MYALISREKIQLTPGTVVRMPGSWADYCTLCGSRGDSSIPRIKYRGGEVLLMSPLRKHGRDANILADVVKALLDRLKWGVLSQTIAFISITGRRSWGAIAYSGALIYRLI